MNNTATENLVRRIDSDAAASTKFAATMADMLEGGCAVTDSARATLPALIAKLRAFADADADAVASRLEAFAA